MFMAVLLERYAVWAMDGGLGQPFGGGTVRSLESKPLEQFSREDRPEVTKRSLGLEEAIKRGAKTCVTT
jgi:hypothetical protein